MFTQKIVDSDAFLDMPLSTQALYFHLNMRADDDGFINNPKKIMRMIGASEDDLKVLCLKRFVIPFESGVMVIKHWKMHNYIQKDRYKPTVYTEELALLEVKENGSYTDCIQAVDNMDTQVSIGKVSKGKVRVVEVSGNGNEVSDNDNNENADDVDESVDNTLEYMGGTLGRGVVLLTEAQIDALLEELGIDVFNYYVDKLATFIIKNEAKVSNHYATIRKWYKEDTKVNG
jgi:hypothetical protein